MMPSLSLFSPIIASHMQEIYCTNEVISLLFQLELSLPSKTYYFSLLINNPQLKLKGPGARNRLEKQRFIS